MTTEYSYRKRSRQRKLRRKRRMVILSVCAVLLIALIIVICAVCFRNKSKNTDNTDNITTEIKENEKIKDGVFIQSVAVGGKNYNEALQVVDEYIGTLSSKELIVSVNGNSVTTTLGKLGLSCDTEKYVRDAFELKENESISLQFDLNSSKVDKFVKNKCTDYNIQAKNAGLKRKNGEFKITKSKTGKQVDETATASLIMSTVATSAAGSYPVNVNAVISETQPDYTSEDMEKCDDILGKFSTTFSEGEIQRSHNLRNAVGFIDGSVVYPGETFSVADKIYPLSADNGYEEAPSYADGEVVESLGGGVCQVSTTLYNAVLRAELEIVERSPHSMVVTYVQPSMDAAIAGDYKDLKFSNNTDTPIYIQGVASGGVITFTVYGDETRPTERSIEFQSVKVETIQPGKDIVTEDKTQPEGYEKVTQQAHVGYVANLYKIIYENGVEQSREKINYSKYNAEPRHVIVGTKKAEDDKNNDNKKDKNKNKNKKQNNDAQNNNTVKPTEAPEQVPETPQTEEPVQTEDSSQTGTEDTTAQ